MSSSKTNVNTYAIGKSITLYVDQRGCLRLGLVNSMRATTPALKITFSTKQAS